MGKSELFLQLAVFATAAAIIGLLIARVYPTGLFKKTAIVPQQSVVSNSEDGVQSSPPTSITIPSINLHLPVAAGAISGNEWTLSENKVSWLTTSETPGKGNVILYSHNKLGLFGNLKNLQIGDEINLETQEKKFSYKVNLKQKVTPNNVNSVLAKGDQLTLYTCDGSFDQKRLIVIATPKRVN